MVILSILFMYFLVEGLTSVFKMDQNNIQGLIQNTIRQVT